MFRGRGILAGVTGTLASRDHSTVLLTTADPTVIADGGSTVETVDRAALRANLERFAGPEAVDDREDGTLIASFGGVTHLTVYPDGRVNAEMPLHEFTADADRLVFDHEADEIHVEHDDTTVEYTFRHP